MITIVKMRNMHVELFCFFALIYPVYLVNPICNGTLNTHEIVRDEPRLVNLIPNGKHFIVGDGYDKINIVHVYGNTPYDMGYALGKLMSEDFKKLVPEYFAYLDNHIETIIKILPPFVSKWIADLGLKGALDLNYDITRKYTPPWYDEELHGLADGSGVSYEDSRRLNLLPELIKAACSVLGAWGESTISPTLLHLRSLDWDEKAPIAKYATITVYHPNASYEGYAKYFHDYYKQEYTTIHTFANFGYLGLIGSIGAYNDVSVGLGQKVWITEEQDITSRFGNPWTYVLRDVIQFSNTIETALTMLINAQRTCSVHLGLGEFDRNTSTENDDHNIGFLGIEYSAKEFNVFSWQDMYNTSQHPVLKDVVYWDPHPQPSSHECFASLLIDHYGHLDAPSIIRNITSLLETGNTLNLVLDYAENAAYIAYSAPDDPKGPIEAFNRVHTRIDMAKLFAEPAPIIEDY